MKPPAFNFVDYAKLQSEMDKRNAYTKILKTENMGLQTRLKTLLSDAEQVAQTEQAMLKRVEQLQSDLIDAYLANATLLRANDHLRKEENDTYKHLVEFSEKLVEIEQEAKILIERDKKLQAENNDLKAMNAKTENNFTQYAEEMNEELTALKRENKTLRNELCLKCGRYIDAHNGSCNGCRWKKED